MAYLLGSSLGRPDKSAELVIVIGPSGVQFRE